MSLPGSITTATYIKWDVALDLLAKLERDATKYEHYKFIVFFALGIYTGLRFSDIMRVTWNNIFEQDYIELREMKTKKYRKIKINPELRKIVMRLYTKCSVFRDGERILINNKNRRAYIWRNIERSIKRAVKKYGIDDGKSGNFTTHSLRKTFARRVWEQYGEDEKALILLNEVFNHSSIKNTIRYLGIRQEEISDIYDCLNEEKAEKSIYIK